MSNPSLVIALVEDEHHRMLVFRYLRKQGLTQHAIRIQRSPSGRGSAEDWVRKEFAKETKEYRLRHARAETALIVTLDADVRSVQYRLNQLDQALIESGIPTVAGDERIARLIPRRNVETWILYLNEQHVDEESDYKGTRGSWNELIPLASDRLRQWARPNASLPDGCLDSLRAGVQELKRLTF